MSIKQNGGVFGRNPTFNDVTIEGQLTFDGDIDINSDLKVDGNLVVDGAATIDQDAVALAFKVTGGNGGVNVAEFSRDIGGDATVGINGNGGDPQIYFESTGNTFALGVNSNTFEISDNAAIGTNTRLSISNVGDVSVSTGNLVIGTSGKGIDFSATSGTGTSELFDDYEEGVWTPAYLSASGAFTSITYDSAVTGGMYTKIGNFVHIQGSIRTDAITVGTASGGVRLSGLPFPAQSSGVGQDGWSTLTIGQITAFAGDIPSSGSVVAGQSYIELQYRTASNGATIDLAVADLDTGTDKNLMRFSATYITG